MPLTISTYKLLESGHHCMWVLKWLKPIPDLASFYTVYLQNDIIIQSKVETQRGLKKDLYLVHHQVFGVIPIVERDSTNANLIFCYARYYFITSWSTKTNLEKLSELNSRYTNTCYQNLLDMFCWVLKGLWIPLKSSTSLESSHLEVG